MPIDLRKHLAEKEAKEKDDSGFVDITNYRSIATLLDDLAPYVHLPLEANDELKECYQKIWGVCYQQQKEAIAQKITKDIRSRFVHEFGDGAASVFPYFAEKHFTKDKEMLCKTGFVSPNYYVHQYYRIAVPPSLDQLAFLGIADKLLSDIGEVYRQRLMQEIAQQTKNHQLKKIFLDDFIKRFEERNFHLNNFEKYPTELFAKYLFLLAADELDKEVDHQIEGEELLTRRQINKQEVIPQEHDNTASTGSGSNTLQNGEQGNQTPNAEKLPSSGDR